MKSITERRNVVKWWQNYLSVNFEGWVSNVGKRGVISGVSRQSRGRLKVRLENVEEGLLPWRSLLTLTYPAVYPKDGRVVKRHLHTLAVWFKRYFGEGFRGVWVMEFQGRGAPHFHLLTNVFVGHGLLGRRWYEIVGSGDKRHLKAGVRAEKPRGDLGRYFLNDYLKKEKQKVVPEGFIHPGRMWGTWGKVGEQLGEVEISEAVAVKVKRVLRRSVERRSRRPLPQEVREGKHRGVTSFRGGELLGAKLLVWATEEVLAGR